MIINTIGTYCDECAKEKDSVVTDKSQSINLCKDCLEFALLVITHPDAHKFNGKFYESLYLCIDCAEPLGNPNHYPSWTPE